MISPPENSGPRFPAWKPPGLREKREACRGAACCASFAVPTRIFFGSIASLRPATVREINSGKRHVCPHCSAPPSSSAVAPSHVSRARALLPPIALNGHHREGDTCATPPLDSQCLWCP